MRWLLVPLLALLMGQNCEPQTPPGPSPENGTDYCWGNEYSVWQSVVQGVEGVWNTIIGGEESTDRRGTVQVFFGSSYCSGVVISPHTVLTAGHCGYAPGVEHRIEVQGGAQQFISTESLVHPDYLKYVNSGNTDREARKADLMMLFVEEILPPPYVDKFYKSAYANFCRGLVAQGYGKAEVPKPTRELREAKYLITEETEKHLRSVRAPDGKICFGDSGGGLYADLNGELQLAGITTTTMSQDCLTGGSHVKVSNSGFEGWIRAGMKR